MENNFYGYIYRVENLITGDFYIGQHRGSFDPRYLGSGVRIRRAVKKYGEANFYIETLMFCKTREETNKQEIILISKNKLKYGKKCMNIARGGEGSCPVPGTNEYEGYIKIWSERGKITNSVSHFGCVKRGKIIQTMGLKNQKNVKLKYLKLSLVKVMKIYMEKMPIKEGRISLIN